MLRTKLTLAGLTLAGAISALAPPGALAAPDPWYPYATSPANAQRSAPFITDTLAPGGKAPVTGHDPWYGYALSLTPAQQSAPLITDTLAPGGNTAVKGYRFITDTLARGGGPSIGSAPAPTGFGWNDAGIGAGGAAGVTLLLLASAQLRRRRHAVAA